jgi:hypothetical protein
VKVPTLPPCRQFGTITYSAQSNSQIKHILHGLEGGLPSSISILHSRSLQAWRCDDDNLQAADTYIQTITAARDAQAALRSSQSAQVARLPRARQSFSALTRLGEPRTICRIVLDCFCRSFSRGKLGRQARTLPARKRHKRETGFGCTTGHLQRTSPQILDVSWTFRYHSNRAVPNPGKTRCNCWPAPQSPDPLSCHLARGGLAQ